MPALFDHPVFRYSRHVFCVLCAGATVMIAGLANPHSVPWLIALYTTAAVLIAALRRFKQSPLHRSFVLYLVALMAYLLIVFALFVCVPGRDPELTLQSVRFWMHYLFFMGILTAPIHFHFTLRFAQFRHWFWKGLEYAGWAGSAYFWITNIQGTYVNNYTWAGVVWVPKTEVVYVQFFYFTSFYLTLGALVPLLAVFTAQTRSRRIQMLFYFFGATPAWLSCWSNFLISYGVNLYPAGGFMFLMHAALIAYAVLVYRAFPVSFKVRRGLAYATCCVVLGAVYAITSLLLIQAEQQNTVSLLIRLVVLLVLIFLYAPLLGWLQQRLDSFFFRDSVDREQLLERFAQETAAILDLTKVAESLCGVLHAGLKPRRVDFYLKPSTQDRFALYGAFEDSFSAQTWPSEQKLPAEIESRLQNETAAFRTDVAAAAQDRVVQLATGDEALAVPVVHGQERLACILIGPKTADEAFTPEDIRFAETLAASSSSVLQNARSFLQIERLQKLTASILNSLSTGVLLITEDGEILTANGAAREICGTGELFPTKINALWEIQPILASAIRRALKERDLRNNDELRLEGARETCVLFSINDLNVDDPHGMYVVMMHDITDYKNMQKLAEQREHLARIGEAAATINHEIKNLLHPIRHQMDRLTRVDVNDPAAIQKELGRATAVVPDRLTALETMLRNLNSLGRPLALKPVQFELESMARAVWSEVSARVQPYPPAFTLRIGDGAHTIVADANWLRQVLYNLLSNAAEATAGCAKPEIVFSAESSAGVCTLKIQDNGRGIDPRDKAKLFEPFYSTKGEAGTGLGLSVCRKIVEAHGGTIAIASENGATVVDVKLPQRTGVNELKMTNGN